jgi:hypothetical protein
MKRSLERLILNLTENHWHSLKVLNKYVVRIVGQTH